MTRVPATYVAIDSRTQGVTPAQVEERGFRILFGREADIENWIHRFIRGATVERWRLEGEDGAAVLDAQILPLAYERNGKARPVDERTTFEPGDVLCLALAGGEEDRARLRRGGWMPADPAPAAEPAAGTETDPPSGA